MAADSNCSFEEVRTGQDNLAEEEAPGHTVVEEHTVAAEEQTVAAEEEPASAEEVQERERMD